jgi:hypothetical protein
MCWNRRVDVFAQAAADDPFELRRHVVGYLADGFRFGRQNGRERPHLHFALESTPAGEHLVRQATHREHIRPPVHRLAFGLFGRHIRDRTDDLALAGQGLFINPQGPGRSELRRSIRLGQLRQSEIDNLHQPAAGHHNVAQLQVSMDDSSAIARMPARR